jgi:hypothetical protein
MAPDRCWTGSEGGRNRKLVFMDLLGGLIPMTTRRTNFNFVCSTDAAQYGVN